MWVLDLLHNFNVIKLDVQELVDRLEGASDGDVILELNSDLMIDEGLEKAAHTG